MKLRYLFLYGFLICILSQLVTGVIADEGNATVNVMIITELSPASYNNVAGDEVNSTIRLLNSLDRHSLNCTIFTTGDMALARPLYITLVGAKDNHELAFNGRSTDEDLTQNSSSNINVVLLRAKSNVESNYVCGGKVIAVKGFFPQPSSFTTENLPINSLTQMGIDYIVDGEGYFGANGGWPYTPENQTISVVPVSTSEISNDNVYLIDRVAKENYALNGTQWYELLLQAYNETSVDGTPMVVVFHNFLSGYDDYYDAYRNFINYTYSNNATFVTTQNLVKMST